MTVHSQGLRLCLGAFRTFVERLYVDAHESSLDARRSKLSLQYVSKIKSPLTHATHDAVFNKKYLYMKMFDICIKQVLTASNIDFSETLSHFSFTFLVYQRTEDSACDTVFPPNTVMI